MHPNLSFVILTWNSERYIEHCLHSVALKCTEEQLAFEIYIVDNGSTDRTLSLIQAFSNTNKTHLKTFRMGRNTGTTISRNMALREAKGEYICVLDSDTRILDGSVSAILAKLSEDREIGIIAPRLLLPDGKVQNSVKKFPTFWHKLVKIPKALLRLRTRDYDFYENFPFSADTFIDTAISACWFFRRDILESVGFLDENIFYSPEDLDFCIRVWKMGKKVLYAPILSILHNTQQVSHHKPFSKLAISHFWGLLYYYRKHGGWLSAVNLYRPEEAPLFESTHSSGTSLRS